MHFSLFPLAAMVRLLEKGYVCAAKGPHPPPYPFVIITDFFFRRVVHSLSFSLLALMPSAIIEYVLQQ